MENRWIVSGPTSIKLDLLRRFCSYAEPAFFLSTRQNKPELNKVTLLPAFRYFFDTQENEQNE